VNLRVMSRGALRPVALGEIRVGSIGTTVGRPSKRYATESPSPLFVAPR
jgi:hypothetical protein